MEDIIVINMAEGEEQEAAPIAPNASSQRSANQSQGYRSESRGSNGDGGNAGPRRVLYCHMDASGGGSVAGGALFRNRRGSRARPYMRRDVDKSGGGFNCGCERL